LAVTSQAQAVLVVDAGTSGVRAAVVRDDATFAAEVAREVLPSSPAGGLVEFDAAELAAASLDVAREALAQAGEAVAAVGISNQRASTVVWDRVTGEPIGPALGWQDLRTIGACLTLRGRDVKLAPNQSATKLQWLLDTYDPRRERDLCFGTVDTWLAWTLSGGAVHATDATNAAVTGLQPLRDPRGWDQELLELLGVPERMMPRIVDTAAVVGEATALPGAPPIASMVGDQQASLAGMACVHRGDAKITFGTGAMLDLNLGDRPRFEARGDEGTFAIVAWRVADEITWGVEAIMLAAGTNVQWLRDDLGLIASAAASHEIASQCTDTGGVVFVPAPLGLGTPQWDYGARAGLFGLTRGTGRAEVVRAVLEGIAQRGADLVDAAEADADVSIPVVRVDGGMSDNPTFVQALADATQRPVEISPVREATTLGAALLAGVAIGTYRQVEDFARIWEPSARIEPQRVLDRDRWREAVQRSQRWIPDLSNIDFA
jgi:glycerol kinase